MSHFASYNQSLDETKKSVSDGKSSIASAITDCGVTTAADATFDTMATNIATVAMDRYNIGFEGGRLKGHDDVTNSPNAYGLYSQAQYDSALNSGGGQATYVYGKNSALHAASWDENYFTRNGNTLSIKKSDTFFILTTGYAKTGYVDINGTIHDVNDDISASNGGYQVSLSAGAYITVNMTTEDGPGANGSVYIVKLG